MIIQTDSTLSQAELEVLLDEVKIAEVAPDATILVRRVDKGIRWHIEGASN